MKIIEAIMADGARTLVGKPVTDDFDVQDWATDHRVQLHLLGVVKIVETYLEEMKPSK